MLESSHYDPGLSYESPALLPVAAPRFQGLSLTRETLGHEASFCPAHFTFLHTQKEILPLLVGRPLYFHAVSTLSIREIGKLLEMAPREITKRIKSAHAEYQ